MEKSTQNIDEFEKKLEKAQEMLKNLKKNMKKIEKMPSEFSNPTRMPDELYEFLKTEKGRKRPRTKEVGEKIHEYIRKYNLGILGTRINADGIFYWIVIDGIFYWI